MCVLGVVKLCLYSLPRTRLLPVGLPVVQMHLGDAPHGRPLDQLTPLGRDRRVVFDPQLLVGRRRQDYVITLQLSSSQGSKVVSLV